MLITQRITPKLYHARIAGVVATTLALLLGFYRLHAARATFDFDDAFMFYRYAEQLRAGHGIAWNAVDGPCYGLTSLSWFLVVLGASFLPWTAEQVLTGASWLAGMLAILFIAFAITNAARTTAFRAKLTVLPLVALALLVNPHFAYNLSNGMETMLAMLLHVLFCVLARRFFLVPAQGTAVWLAVVGLFAVLTRPEAALCVTLIPLLGWLLLGRDRQPGFPKAVLVFLGVFAALLALELLACALYFHSALPLSFYMKSRHAYQGYADFWDWPKYLQLFFETVSPALAAPLLFLGRQHLRRLVVFVLPVALTFAYLGTVTQIMGEHARYYLPYLPFVVLPIAWLSDECLAETRTGSLNNASSRWESGALRAAALVFLIVYPTEYMRLSYRLSAHLQTYPAPVFQVPACAPLPQMPSWTYAINAATETLLKPLPPGAVVAASEIGLLGASAPQVTVVDLAGLNDIAIARHGFTPAYLYSRAPDLIWLPHTDYTYQYGVLASDPALLRDYTVYAGAFNYGIALRRASPLYLQMEASLRRSWNRLYPGTAMNDYVVSNVTWQPGPTKQGSEKTEVHILSTRPIGGCAR